MRVTRFAQSIVTTTNKEVEVVDTSVFVSAIKIFESLCNPPIYHCTLTGAKNFVKVVDASYLKQNNCKLCDKLLHSEGMLVPPHVMANAWSLTKRRMLTAPTFGVSMI